MAVYQKLFSELGRAAFIPFFVIGDPDEEMSFAAIKAAVDAGADVLELGIPFSDPIADGPTIQKADTRAMQAGMTPPKALAFIARVTAYKPVPVGLLVYYNLIYQYGIERFFADFKKAGGTSVLVADLSVDDADEIVPAARAAGVETVFMVTPITSDARIKLAAEKTTGFLYAVTLLGTTGERDDLSAAVGPLIARLKSLTDKPVCLGFGISTPEHAKQAARAGADGVIIGSRIVKLIEDNLGNPDTMQAQIGAFVTQVRQALQA